MDKTEKLLKAFTEVCDELISEAHVVTDGRRFMTAVLDYDLAEKLCKMAKQNSNADWRVLNIPTALEFAFRTGYAIAQYEMQERNGGNDEKDSELRECELPEQKESD